tara:strand:- start:690 stop:809 length:120 start_codon:yes stop_codon:yes gene_type:complete
MGINDRFPNRVCFFENSLFGNKEVGEEPISNVEGKNRID